jgi:trehalose/maltose transport system substrate-binding protein
MQRVVWSLVFVAVLTACGAARNTPAVKLTIFGFGLAAGEQLREDALTEFTRRTGIEVDLIPTPGSSEEQLAVIREIGTTRASTPDVFLIDVVWPGALQEHLLDLTPYLTADARTHVKSLLESDTVNGRVVSLPLYLNAGMLYYRTDLLTRYGYTKPPGSWDELRTMALRIQRGERERGKSAFWGYIWQGAEYEGLTCNALEWQASHGGGRIVERDGQVSVNNPRVKRALESAARWIGTISPTSVLTYTESDTLNVFRAGNAAFMRHWSSTLPTLRAQRNSTVAVALLPAGESGRAYSVGGFHLGVSRYSAQAREAAQLVLYLTSKEVQMRRALRRGYLPTYPDLLHNAELLRALPQAEVLRHAEAEHWVARPSTVSATHYPGVSRAYYQAVHRILSGTSGAAQELAALEQDLTHRVAFRKDPRQN